MRRQLIRQWRVDEEGRVSARPPAFDRERCCLTDEIAIDFPAVSEAVARMRHAFCGADEAHEPLRAEIALSSGQATRGADVSIVVPVRRTCAACGGRGETWGEPCGPCAGSGCALVRHAFIVSVPAGVADGDRFSFSLAHPSGPRTRIELRVAVA